MARKAGSTVARSTPTTKHWWNTQERHVVFVLYTEYNQTNQECADLFNHHYGHAFAVRPTDERIRDEFASRHEAGRSKMWNNHIERQTYTVQQEAERTQAGQMIQTAAQALGITLNPLANAQAGVAVAGSVATASSTAAAIPPATTATGDGDGSDGSSDLSSVPPSPVRPSKGKKRARDVDEADSNEDTEENVDEGQRPAPSPVRPPKGKKRARDDDEADSNEDTEENIDEGQRPAPISNSTRTARADTMTTVAPPARPETSEDQDEDAPRRPAPRTHTRYRIVGPRDMDTVRNARPVFPHNYRFMNGHQFEASPRILPVLDARFAAEVARDIEQAQHRVNVLQETLRRLKAQTADELLARTEAAQLANGTITPGQPAQIFTQQPPADQQTAVQETEERNGGTANDGESGGTDGEDSGEDREEDTGRVANRIARVIAREMSTPEE